MYTEDNQQQQNLQQHQTQTQQPDSTSSHQSSTSATNNSSLSTLSSNNSSNSVATVVSGVTPSHHHHHHPHHHNHQNHHHHQFRQVCFNPSTKVLNPTPTNTLPSSSLNATTNPNSLITPTSTPSNVHQSQQNNSRQVSSTSHKRLSSSSQSSTNSSDSSKRIRLDNNNNSTLGSSTATTTNTPINKTPKFIRKFRSRSLPIINFNSNNSAFFSHNLRRKHNFNNQQQQQQQQSQSQPTAAPNQQQQQQQSVFSTIPPLPPINLQSLKEIDLHEILKNPQLRHDILFDPQLQFRPNLDGERGKRKKSIIDKYWLEIQKECQQFFIPNLDAKTIKINRLPILFTTLRDILLSLLPTKDRQQVSEIMDIDLLVQQLRHGSFDFVEMSKWLAEVFKSHCAPMRDQWVMEMSTKFIDAASYNSVGYLVGGLRMIFQILEAMKLDVANHQIRILRPVLIETAVDFERDYFQTLINHQKININDSLNWFYKKFVKKTEDTKIEVNENNIKPIVISSIIDLLSCRQMATEFPSTLTFDHTRLVLLRADVRQLVCVQLCVVLYKQLVVNSKSSVSLLSQDQITKVQQEILAIVTDDNGNIKWTKNINAISLQLVKNLYPQGNNENLPIHLVEFSHNWLMKHIQPNSEVYGLMEIKIFKELLNEIMSLVISESEKEESKNNTINSNNSTTTTNNNNTTNNTSEMKNIATRISTLVNFHWNVFGSYYLEYIKNQYTKLQLLQAAEEEEKRQQQLKLNVGNSSPKQQDDNSVILDHSQQSQQTRDHRNNTNGGQNTNNNNNGEIDSNSNSNNPNSAPLSMLS
ncbi:SOK1 [Candida jiufengensis]|uniref:SOK1 n=1 Tax=Candida jiufengensis TaxID=497108 RepID=UPI0022250BB4|nr:SOK1 [Candida jiufengensis]KAI5954226.1 SOK1 [Candida jiufengensis]